MRIFRWKPTQTLLALFVSSQALAVTVSDDFTQAVNSNDWAALYYACLTAGTPSNNTTSTSNIPGCNYSSPDAVGSGALRLTPASGSQHGAIVSNYTFPSNQGLQATFTTYSYGGSGDGLAREGADGISFFLMDGSVGTSVGGTSNLGSWGGSLGYSCSNVNTPYTGLTGAYLGLGIDEYGNFLNGGSGHDNTASGIPVQTSSSSANGYNNFVSGSYQQANRIGLRGAGNVSWYWLNQNYPAYYPSSLSASLQQAAVKNTCTTGTLWNYAGATSQLISGNPTVSGTTLTVTVPSVGGYMNGDSITIGGTITGTPQTQLISGTPTVSGSTMTLTVPSVSGYSNGQSVTLGGSITANPGLAISSFSNYSSGTVRVNISNTSAFTVGGSVTISGATGTNSSYVNGTHTIASISNNSYLKINVSTSWSGSTYPSVGTAPNNSYVSTGNPVSIAGAYTIANLNSGAKTFQVTLATAATAITNTSGNVGVTPIIPGNYTISNVNAGSNTFQVSLGVGASAISNTSGSIINNSLPTNSGRQLGTTIMDYPVIPGGYWVLPSTNLIANEGASTRASATPITYKLTITPAGLLSLMYSYNGGAYQQVLTNWPITSGNGPLPPTFRFGFAGSTGGSWNTHEITCFVAEPTESSSSAVANTIQAGQVRTGTQVYLASYNPNNWSGSLVSDAIVNTSGVLSIATAADWDGNCVLTGGGCPTMGTTGGVPTHSITVESPSSRQLLTWNGSIGIPLQWARLTSAQQSVLNSTDTSGNLRLNWLRGDRSNEQTATPAGPLRTRAGVLGDIIDSAPTWIGPPAMGYAPTFVDSLYGTGSETSYSSFRTSQATRLNVVYVGSNDGMLHGFRTGANNSDGTYNGTNNDGYEVIGFMPAGVLASTNVVGLTGPTYAHNYFVDAQPGFGDLFYNNAWHTWLVGGLGAGGAEIYALDVTDPTGASRSTLAFSEGNATSLVIGDWTPSTLTTCVNATSNCGDNLGNTTGTPLIRRLHNGQWAIIFGNGLGSTNGHAGVFIGLVSPSSGAVSFQWLDTGVGSSTTPNGIAYIASADLDGDHVTDYLYGGDLLGNVWRFDLTSSNPSDWGVSNFGKTSPTPLFVATNAGGTVQPITTRIAVTATMTGGAKRVILGFGTGRAIPFTATTPVNYASGTQTVYGIWDWDMSAWSSGRATSSGVAIPGSSVGYAMLPQISTAPYRTFTRSNLLANSVAAQSGSSRTAAMSNVCWQGTTTCTSNNSQYGWMFDLPGTREQIIYSPIFSGGELFANTIIPPQNTLGQCSPLLPTGWTMAFNMASGGGTPQNVFPDSRGSLVVASGQSSIVGQMQNAVGTPYVVSVGSQQYVVDQTIGGNPTIIRINPQGGVTIKRISWEQLR
ncbi:MAG: PilC/PilY family type IV pilus protein [Rhodocyclaceae bacterium]|nr:PilC/PilY family type IV pilus protein [Rhodocyclaceae bacterium]